jgi:hypothetical protein
VRFTAFFVTGAMLAIAVPAAAHSTFSWQNPPQTYKGWITYSAHKVDSSPGEQETTGAVLRADFTLKYGTTIRKARTPAWSETYYNGTARYTGKSSDHTVTTGSCGSQDIDVNGSGSMGLRLRFTPNGYLVGPTSPAVLKGVNKYPVDDTDCSKGFAQDKTHADW